MPRTKEYDRERVLDRAMKVFWKKGYDGTSVQDLVKATGLNRFGMYEAFGNKEGLFLEALDKYRNATIDGLFVILEKDPQGMASIQAFFDRLIQSFSKAKGNRGCLVVNTAVDTPVMSANANRRVKNHLKRMEEAFLGGLMQARKRKEIDPKSDVKALALYLVGITQGLAVFHRANTEMAQMKGFVKTALTTLVSGPKKT